MPRVMLLAALCLISCKKEAPLGAPIQAPQWAPTMAEQFCVRFEECELGRYLNEYEEQDACIKGEKGALEDFYEEFEGAGCTYDDVRAGQGHEALASMTCEDFVDKLWKDTWLDAWICDG